MRYALSLLLLLHGAIYLLGAVKGLRLGEVSQLTQPITARMGWLWLLAAALLMSAAVLSLVPLVIALAEWLPSSLRSQYEHASALALAASPTGAPPLVSESELAPLPEPVRRWLTRAGVVG